VQVICRSLYPNGCLNSHLHAYYNDHLSKPYTYMPSVNLKVIQHQNDAIICNIHMYSRVVVTVVITKRGYCGVLPVVCVY
jgi:hypothetical protein